MLKAGLVGLGRMGLTHLAVLNTHPDVEFVAVCDSSRFQLNTLLARMPVRGYRDSGKMLDECDLDLLIVATPTASHAEMAKRAISRNIHIFIEKPLSLRHEDSRAIVDMVKQTGLVNQVGYVNRFNPVFAAVKRHVNDGILGDTCHVRSTMYGRTVLRDSKSAWRTQTKSGGGCLYEFASHCIDLVNYLIGPPERVVGSVLQKVYSSGAEDAVYSTFLYGDGSAASIEVNWSDASFRKPTNRIEILGTKGKIIADKHAYKIFLREPDECGLFDKGWNVRYVTDLAGPVRFYVRGNEFTNQLDHFILCIKDRRVENVCPCEAALETDIVINEIVSDGRRR